MTNNLHKSLITCRYFLRIAYIGTRYKGLQRQTRRTTLPSNDMATNDDDECSMIENISQYFDDHCLREDGTIQTAIENALNRGLSPVYDARLALSSRTDSGVHALMNTANVDLTHPLPATIYRPSFLISITNRILMYSGHDITLLDARMVSSSFHSRINAKYRSYKYLFALIITNNNHDDHHRGDHFKFNHNYSNLLPVTLLNRCHLVNGPLDLDQMAKCCEIFKGHHNFLNFQTLTAENRYRSSWKTIQEFQLNKIEHFSFHPNNNPLNYSSDFHNTKIEFYEFFIKSESFLYNQIRRMIAAIFDVGRNRLTLEEVQTLLNVKDNNDNNEDDASEPFGQLEPRSKPLQRQTIPPSIRKRLSTMVPACGLYLVDVGYDEQDFKLNENFNEYSPKIMFFDDKSFQS